MRITGKWEFEVAPGRAAVARAWVRDMQRRYEREVGRGIDFRRGTASDNGFALDDSVRGLFEPRTSRIVVFYAEENDLATLAEELAHYFQYQRQGLLGRSVRRIGRTRIDANERAMRHIMLSHGFRVRR
jgi:hypothetical protein